MHRAFNGDPEMHPAQQPAGEGGPFTANLDPRDPPTPRERSGTPIADPSARTWLCRVRSHSGTRGPDHRTRASADHVSPRAMIRRGSPSRSSQSNSASVFGSAQFARPPTIEASESTAMNGTCSEGRRLRSRGAQSAASNSSTSRARL